MILQFSLYLMKSLTTQKVFFLEKKATMSEKLCLKWNDYQENVTTAFGSFRGDIDFSDVTLASDDGQQVEAHKVILAA